jgi:hypothetical protein
VVCESDFYIISSVNAYVIQPNCLLPHSKPPCHANRPGAVTVGELFALVLQKWSERPDLGTNIMGSISDKQNGFAILNDNDAVLKQ